MSFNNKMDHDKQFIIVEYEGELPVDKLKVSTTLLKVHLEAKKWRKILADCRNAKLALRFFDQYDFTTSSKKEFPDGTKIGILGGFLYISWFIKTLRYIQRDVIILFLS